MDMQFDRPQTGGWLLTGDFLKTQWYTSKHSALKIGYQSSNTCGGNSIYSLSILWIIVAHCSYNEAMMKEQLMEKGFLKFESQKIYKPTFLMSYFILSTLKSELIFTSFW